EAPLPAGDGAAGAEQDGGDGRPGVAGGQQQDDMGAQAELGVRVGAVAIQEGMAFLGRQLDTEVHGLAPLVKRLAGHPSPEGQAVSHYKGCAYAARDAVTFPYAWRYLV